MLPAETVLRRCAFAVGFILFFACSAHAQPSYCTSQPRVCPGASRLQCGSDNKPYCCSGSCCTPLATSATSAGVGLPAFTPNVLTTNDFATNFLPTTAQTSYETPFNSFQNGATGAGDWNVQYGALDWSYSSIAVNGAAANEQTWTSTCGGTGCVDTPGNLQYCPVELAIAGTYPNARYFSISNYDDHYTIAQHIADFEIDPSTTNQPSPYTSETSWSQTMYVVPVSLSAGSVPAQGAQQGSGPIPGCLIQPYEEDNLLDGTQRHPAADWNTDVYGTPNIAFPQSNHTVDYPDHSNPSPNGSVHVRAYLSPPYGGSNCAPANVPAGNLSCSIPADSFFPSSSTGNSAYGNTYFMVRDSYTGCPYTSNSVGGMVVPGLPGQGNPAAGQFLATVSCATNAPGQSAPCWANHNQMNLHLEADAWTPQLCYANGDPSAASPNPMPNRAVWVRTPNHVAGQAPDDAYLSASISQTDLQNLTLISACPQLGEGKQDVTNECALRFRFQLPTTPTNTPCQPTEGGSGTYSSNCALPQNPDQLRYMSLTFGYLPNYAPGTPVSTLADIDGENHLWPRFLLHRHPGRLRPRPGPERERHRNPGSERDSRHRSAAGKRARLLLEVERVRGRRWQLHCQIGAHHCPRPDAVRGLLGPKRDHSLGRGLHPKQRRRRCLQ